MKRVHRNLSRDEVEALRDRLTSLVPIESASISELLRMMRLIARKSQAEYARMCGVAPRVLANVEGGTGSPTVETLGKLLSPFGYRVGVVMESARSMDSAGSRTDAAADNLQRKSGTFKHQKPSQADSQVVVESALGRALEKDRRRQGE